MNDQGREWSLSCLDPSRFRRLFGLEWTTSRSIQIAVVLSSWIYLCALHAANNGLHFDQDAARHLANGIFWKDYLTNPTVNPKEFALRYHARYPYINPTSYPPVFYVLEASAFATLGASPFVAKSLVLLFALAASVYTMAWLRRFVTSEAGYFGALIPLLPGMVSTANAIMLNVPSFALSLAALYHGRRWLDEPDSRQIFPAAILSVIAILCYIPSAVLVLVLVAWIVALRLEWVLVRPRTIGLAAISGLALVPWMMIVLNWSPGHVEMTTPSPGSFSRTSSLTYYWVRFPELFGWDVTILACTGGLLGLLDRRFRRETSLFLIWIATMYFALTYLKAKDIRYALPLAAPLTGLTAVAVSVAWRALSARLPHRLGGSIVLAGVLTLLASLAWKAGNQPLPSVRGFEELANFVGQIAPDEPVFYNGHSHGLFTVHVMASDKAMRRQVVRGDKLLYVDAFSGASRPRSFVATSRDVIEALQTRSGCRWLVIERAPPLSMHPAGRLLQEAVQGPEFEWFRSFLVFTPCPQVVDIYRMLIPVSAPKSINMPFPILGSDVWINTSPIQRGGGQTGLRPTGSAPKP